MTGNNKNNEKKNKNKKVWEVPKIFPLHTKRTEGGSYPDTNEDYGEIDTMPNS
jgi:hypothetical protein